jgi:hypothetical protein
VTQIAGPGFARIAFTLGTLPLLLAFSIMLLVMMYMSAEVTALKSALANRGQVGFTLLYCDLDHFKRVNDRFGHGRGDEVLCQFANLATDAVRSVDYVARIGSRIISAGTGWRWRGSGHGCGATPLRSNAAPGH